MARMRLFATVVLVSVAATAQARSPVPIVNYNWPIVAPSGRVVTDGDVRNAIIRAAASLGWTLVPDGDKKFVATLVVRNKHTVVADVTYSAEKYSVVYKSSINMKYGVDDGVPVIHPFYNDWARTFAEGIRNEIVRAEPIRAPATTGG
ncbi:MAG TPA: hypothetical protein VMT17_06170 [Anaeromyxobacteraceae bacterium]|nr:hypothetical protein [Anaeromyxobacteraceae bacterium]